VLGSPPAVSGGTRAPTSPARGELRLHGVTHDALRGLTAELPAGAFVGVLAADPESAHALLQCLARDADPASGEIQLDGMALTELDPVQLHRAVLVAPHDADLFEQTLAENVAAAASERGDLDRALAAAVADEVAAALPDGLQTRLAERGSSLSGGQRQRVALARALAADPIVLVLHDPTTAVDAATEAKIATGLREIRRGRSTLVLTSSPALLAACDRVIVIEDGTVADSGGHGELLRRNAAYRAAVLG